MTPLHCITSFIFCCFSAAWAQDRGWHFVIAFNVFACVLKSLHVCMPTWLCVYQCVTVVCTCKCLWQLRICIWAVLTQAVGDAVCSSPSALTLTQYFRFVALFPSQSVFSVNLNMALRLGIARMSSYSYYLSVWYFIVIFIGCRFFGTKQKGIL